MADDVGDKEKRYKEALKVARRELAASDPQMVALQSAVEYKDGDAENGELLVDFWGERYRVAYPQGTVEGETGEPSMPLQILILHYLLTADGTPLSYNWVSFRDFGPETQTYYPAFQGRAEQPLVGAFGRDLDAFKEAAAAKRGEKLDFGDASFRFRVFPRVWVAIVVWAGDEEFSPSVQLLFDGSANHYLPAEDLAVLGGMVSSGLAKLAR
jgi:hypothetical protein